jgi:hypothetical protein
MFYDSLEIRSEGIIIIDIISRLLVTEIRKTPSSFCCILLYVNNLKTSPPHRSGCDVLRWADYVWDGILSASSPRV